MAKAKAGSKKGKSAVTKGKKSPKKALAATRKSAKPKKPAQPKARRAAPAAHAAAPSLPVVRPDPVRELAKRIVSLSVAGDDAGCLALYADTAESVEPGMPPYVGIEGIKQKYAQFRSMISGIQSQARNVWVDGNTIIVEWANKMTFANGNTVESSEVAIHEIENGKIVRERYYYDRSAMPPPGA